MPTPHKKVILESILQKRATKLFLKWTMCDFSSFDIIIAKEKS